MTDTTKSCTELALINLERTLRDALGEVERGCVLIDREGDLSTEDWSRIAQVTHAVGDALTSLNVERSQATKESTIKEIVDLQDGNESVTMIVDKVAEAGPVTIPNLREQLLAAYRRGDTAEKRKNRLYLGDKIKEALRGEEMERAVILADLNQMIGEEGHRR
ncbi:hypothetical protein ACFV42_49450 [Streptomyces solisilvae]|uniref:hypothetical protein n=1 Tax=Streptomyces malaysiensis TaxID=92644 RepID=UPI0036D030E7